MAIQTNTAIIDFNVDAKLPVINSNFEAVKEALSNSLKKYDFIVDEDSIKLAKSIATDINSLSKNIDTLRKNKVSELSVPIKDFDTKAKELIALCQTSRENLLNQVKVFEDKERERCLSLLKEELKLHYERYRIQSEFQNIEITDLAILSNLTKNGIAKKAVDAILDRILSVKAFQNNVEKRLLTLEGTCLKAGLKVAFTRDNISHFIMTENEEIYKTKLNELINNELKRQEELERKLQEENEKKYGGSLFDVPAETRQEIKIEPIQEPQFAEQSINLNVSNNICKYIVTATFEVECSSKIENKLEEMLLQRFVDANFKITPIIKIKKGF